MVSAFGDARPGHGTCVEQRGNKIYEMPEYAAELGRIETLSLEELKKEASRFHSVEDGFDFKVPTIKPWLETRMKTFQSIPILVNQDSGSIAAERPRKLLREYVVMEKILAHVKKANADVSKGWLEQAKKNRIDFDTFEDKAEKKPLLKKISTKMFLGSAAKISDRKRVPPTRKNLPGCARCGNLTGYTDGSGKFISTAFRVIIDNQEKLQVCRACLKVANAQAAKPHSMRIIKMRDRLDVVLSKQEGATLMKNHSLGELSIAKMLGKAENPETYENKGEGTDADPILLSSSDDEGDGSKKSPSPRCKAVVNPYQRKTRRSSKIETDSILDSLKCSMPPKGGLGAVTFMLRDYMKLRPYEFMNDSCIDYFFKLIEVKLKIEDPEKWERCYFFNSFFYKKLTDDTSVSILSEETKALADCPLGELDKLSLQALRCYDVTKRWTKNVDLFSKDFLFIPIHDQLHWSLVIVCHPGSGIIRGNEKDGPEAFMLHLDSMKAPAGHNSEGISKLIKRYLQNEWKAKLQQDGESVPKEWVQQHPEKVRNFLRMVMRRPHVPIQENHYDCGSFVCAFLDHFIAKLPSKINTQMVPIIRKSRFFSKGITPAVSRQPTFLTRKWFQSDNASNLRHYLAITVLKAMAVNAGVMDDFGRWKMEGLSQEQQHKMTFLIHTLETLESEGKYSPPTWNDIGEDVQDDAEDDDDDDAEDEDTCKIEKIEIQDVESSQPSDHIEDMQQNLDPIHSIDEDEIEIENSDVDVKGTKKKAHNDNPSTPADDRAKLRQIKKRKDLRNTPDVDVIAQCHKGGEIEVFNPENIVTFSKRKNKFARKIKPSLIGRSQVNTAGLADCYKSMPKEAQDTLKNSFHQG